MRDFLCVRVCDCGRLFLCKVLKVLCVFVCVCGLCMCNCVFVCVCVCCVCMG